MRLLWAEGDAEQKAWCEQRAEADKAGPVRMLVEEWASLATVGPNAEEVTVERPAGPFTVEIRFRVHHDAYRASHYPGAVAVGDDTVRLVATDWIDVLRAITFWK